MSQSAAIGIKGEVSKPSFFREENLQIGDMIIAGVAYTLMATPLPSTRLAGILALRTICLISTLGSAKEALSNNNRVQGTLKCAKAATLVLGIVASAAASPILITAYFAADIGLNAIELGRALESGDKKKALTHLTAIVLDALILSAVATGSTKIMLVAVAVSAIAIGVLIAQKMQNLQKAPSDQKDRISKELVRMSFQLLSSITYLGFMSGSLAGGLSASDNSQMQVVTSQS